ncbi:hypothetical protein RDWZM_008354 [Blomia tropicalis]|uniref:Uncharacterized protein n=1 Tax=Blomia tropicalis TaxID=40697 RepID=A0A9Q0M3G9_BLOTA|nr:hypothetical protein RDWZM_008354 [Blomia tropicalis]
MEYRFNLLVNQFWNDRRLAFTSKHNITQLVIGEEFGQNIWKPDTLLLNGESWIIPKIVSTDPTLVVRIKPNGDVSFSARVILKVHCPINWFLFPLDRPKCPIEITSYAFTEPAINYQWADYVPVEVHNRINMPMFHHLIGYNKRNSFELESSMSNRTSLIVELFFSRSIGYYMLNVYIPITIVVVMSWIPFWLNRNDHLMRIIFEAIITLIMTTMIVNVNSIIPQAIHWKMIDLYLLGCLSTILLSMFECTLISYFEYKNKKMTQLGASILVTGRVVMFISGRKPFSRELDVEQYTTDLLNKLIPEGYNKNLRPNYGGEPVRVNVSLLIDNISAISETAMVRHKTNIIKMLNVKTYIYKEFKIDLYVRHFWRDHRLSFPVKFNIDQITLAEDFTKQIWQPDTYFANGRELSFHRTIPSEETTLFRIKHNGDIIYSTRVILLAQCPMDLTYFPLDQQKCSVEISSYGLSNTEMIYQFCNDGTAVEFNRKINLPTFHMIGYNIKETEKTFSTGNYSHLFCDMILVRSVGYYISQVYVPACLIVVISWIPFWLDQNDHHARVALGVTTVLTMTTLITNMNVDFPKISHLTAIDIYLFTCFVMVFFSLIEYAVVGYHEVKGWELHRRQIQMKNARPIGDKDAIDDEYMMYNVGVRSILPHPTRELAVNRRRRIKLEKRIADFRDTSIIDHWARRIFPISFALFNIIYILMVWALLVFMENHQHIEFRV